MTGGFEEKLSRVLASHVPGFEALVSAERLSGGASQETHRLRIRAGGAEQRLALRRATDGTRQPGAPGMRAEAALMRHARAAGVPEPEIHHVLEPEDGLGEGFVMAWVAGETLGARIVKAPELEAIRPRLARQCGEILARIHAIDLAATGLDTMLEKLSPEAFVSQLQARYESFATPQPMIDYTARWLLEHLPESSRETLVHNDFRNGNLIVTPEGVVAVLDWEIAHVGDPMRDLGWICTNSWRFGRSELPVGGFGRYEDLFQGYESVSGTKVDPEHVRFWEIFGSFWWAVGCLTMAEMDRQGPVQTVERPGIGRRSSECQVDCVNLLIPGSVELLEAPPAASRSSELPRVDELVTSVREFLRGEVMEGTRGRLRFLTRVAANSLGVVARDLAVGDLYRERELARLRALLGGREELEALRWRLVHALRSGSLSLDDPALIEHLRATVVNQVAIDQPGYSGLRTALAPRG